MPGDTTKELKMKAKPVLVCVVLLATLCLAGCISKTGTGTGNNYAHRADSAPEGVVVGTARQSEAKDSVATAK